MQERSFQPRSSIRKKMILGFFVVLTGVGDGAGVEACSARINEGSVRLATARVRRVLFIIGIEGCKTPLKQKSCKFGCKMYGKDAVHPPLSAIPIKGCH